MELGRPPAGRGGDPLGCLTLVLMYLDGDLGTIHRWSFLLGLMADDMYGLGSSRMESGQTATGNNNGHGHALGKPNTWAKSFLWRRKNKPIHLFSGYHLSTRENEG